MNLVIGEISIPITCSTISLTLPIIFKSRNAEEDKAERENDYDDVCYDKVTIEAVEAHKPQKVILEKPSVEMTKNIKRLRIKCHYNGKLVLRVLVKNGSTVNVMLI